MYGLIKINTSRGPEQLILYGMDLKTDENHIQCYHTFLASETAADYIPMLQQELEQAQRYNADEPEDDDDDKDDNDNDEVPSCEEPEEWMLLCRLNQQYDHDISHERQSHETPCLTGQKLSEQCLLVCFGNLQTG